MRWLRPRAYESLDDHKIPRRETYGGALFIFASVVVILKIVNWQFDRVFFIAAAIGIVLFTLTRYKLAYIAATTGWMAFRFVVGVVLYRESRALPWAIGLGALTWFLLYIAAKRENG
jgi:hypothetical protein